MSGGRFNYDQFRIKSIAEEIEEYLDDMGKEKDDVNPLLRHDFYDKYPEERYNPVESEEVQEKMREAVKALKVAYTYAQRIDWYLSGDDGEESFLSRLEQELKEVELNGDHITVHIEKTSTGYSAYYKSDDGLVSSTGDTLTELLENLSDATPMSED